MRPLFLLVRAPGCPFGHSPTTDRGEKGQSKRHLKPVKAGFETAPALENIMLVSDQLRARLEQLARRAAEPVGVEVAWIELKPERSSWCFRVYIDRESGVGLEECERVSERLGVLLDVEDPIESSYTLEVSTPGLDRPLWNKQDYERFVGKLVRIKTRECIADRTLFKGRLIGVETDQILIDERGESRRIPFTSVESGRLEVEFFRPLPENSANRKGRRSKSKARKRS